MALGKAVQKFPEYPGMVPTPAPTARSTQANIYLPVGERGRFMEQAAFGPNNALDFRLRQIGLRRWVEEQFGKPYPTIPYPNFPLKPFDADVGCGVYGTSPEVNLCHRNHYWAYNNQKWLVLEALYGDDQLRRRVSWALHQIWVVSQSTVYQQRWLQEYIEILDRNAFGNYRDLMGEMTLSPAMGEYLDMVRSTRQNPNENYPRELLQLFTIGLYKLNQDGTLFLDGQGNRIPTYDQDKINQFTKVFTGWSQCNNGTNPACANAVVGAPNFIDPMYLTFPGDHDQTAKTLFDYPGAPNQTIAACTNCTTDAARRAVCRQTADPASRDERSESGLCLAGRGGIQQQRRRCSRRYESGHSRNFVRPGSARQPKDRSDLRQIARALAASDEFPPNLQCPRRI
jgi:hypothetical protein